LPIDFSTNLPSDELADRKRAARSFNQVAEDYDRYRPSYPAAIFERILERVPEGGRVLEVGSGTGKASQPFVEHGCSLVCIEPGGNLAAVARRKFSAAVSAGRVEIIPSTFEEWDLQPQAFDLVLSAQAWHWIDPDTGYARAAHALKRTGTLAVFWNLYPPQASKVTGEMNEVYSRVVPEMVRKMDDTEEVIRMRVQEIQHSGLFDPAHVHRFTWRRRYTAAEHIGLLGTYSDHLALPEEKRQRLFLALADVIEKHGGVFERQYLTVLFVAAKRAAWYE
jgi:SAM-dependent methyltransferase